MTNREMIAAIAAKTALSQQTSREVLQTVIDTIQDAVWDGDRVTLTDFGSFYLAERKGRAAATKYPKFVPAKKFQDLVR